MIGNEFEKLAKSLKVDLEKIDNKHHVGDGSFLPTSKYVLRYEFQNCQVTIENELGHQNIGNIEFLLPIQSHSFQFEMRTRTILSQLWNRKKSPIEVISSNVSLVKWIEENEAFEKLCERARKDRFEPIVMGVNTKDGLSVKCTYHLVFNNYELTLDPFARFFNGLIDFVQREVL